MEYHELANLFPLLEGEEFTALVEDVRDNGLLEPVWIYEEKILDGRNRYRACVEAGVQPWYRSYDGANPLQFVLSMNLKRRHLNSGQRAMLALEVEKILAEEAKKRQATHQEGDVYLTQNFAEAKGEAREQAATMVGTNHTYITDAKKVSEYPELAQQVIAGTKPLYEAAKEIRSGAYGKMMDGNHDSGPEWYTPQRVIDLATTLMGAIDLDPCSNSHEHPNVPAFTCYTKEDDGLSKRWTGRIFLNPPYGDGIADWIDKLVDSYKVGDVKEAVVLIPGRIDTAWIQPLYDYQVCMVRGRLLFANAENSAPFPSIVAYIGTQEKEFVQACEKLGPVLVRDK